MIDQIICSNKVAFICTKKFSEQCLMVDSFEPEWEEIYNFSGQAATPNLNLNS